MENLKEIKLKMTSKNNTNNNANFIRSINYYIYPCLFLEIYKPVMYNKDANSKNIYIKLTMKDHLFIKHYFDFFEKQIIKLGVDTPCNSYHIKDQEKGEFLIRLNVPKKYNVHDFENGSIIKTNDFPVINYTFNKIKIKIKNLWVIENKDKIISGTNIEIDSIFL
jgi:hypothetical protein